MKNSNHDHVIGIPVSSVSCAAKELLREPASVPESDSPYLHYKEDKKEPVVDRTSKFSKKANSYVQGIREHVSLGPKISETLKGKLSLGARILQAGGIERVFRQAFPVSKGEKLVKALQCYLSTTAGPIAGMLFISTEKIAFHSDRSLTLTSPKGDLARIPYKIKLATGDWTASPQCSYTADPLMMEKILVLHHREAGQRAPELFSGGPLQCLSQITMKKMTMNVCIFVHRRENVPGREVLYPFL